MAKPMRKPGKLSPLRGQLREQLHSVNTEHISFVERAIMASKQREGGWLRAFHVGGYTLGFGELGEGH